MLFAASITIPANTVQDDPTEVTFKLAHGVITKFMIRPRPGHAALAHLAIFHLSHQIAPSTEGMKISGDTSPIDWEEFYEFYQPPYELRLQGWNDDDTYEHTFDIFVAILPRKAILPYALVDALRGLFGMMVPRRIFSRGD